MKKNKMLFVVGVTLALLGGGFAGHSAFAAQPDGPTGGMRNNQPPVLTEVVIGDKVPLFRGDGSHYSDIQVAIQVRGRQITRIAGSFVECPDMDCTPSHPYSADNEAVFTLTAQANGLLRNGRIDVGALHYESVITKTAPSFNADVTAAYQQSLRSAINRPGA